MLIQYNQTTNQHLIDRVKDYIETFRKTHSDMVDGIDPFFIFYFGPAMVMTTGLFEYDVNEIVSSPVSSCGRDALRFMCNCAYLIRKINSRPYNTTLVQKCMREFNSAMYEDFNGMPKIMAHTQAFLINLTNYIKSANVGNITESFMTASAPIVPYEQTVVGSGIERSLGYINPGLSVPTSINSFISSSEDTKLDELNKLLYPNIFNILLNWDSCKVYTGLSGNDVYPYDLMLKELRKNNRPDQLYFLYSALAYNRLSIESFSNITDEYTKMYSINPTQVMESMSNGYLLDDTKDSIISLEMWGLDVVDEIGPMKEQIERTVISSNRDFYKLENYISVHRYMQFDDATNRRFTESLDHGRIINVNDMGSGKIFYEIGRAGVSSELTVGRTVPSSIVCPFLDLRDYKVRALVMITGENTIDIIEDFSTI